jgi:acyl-coenzyme A thioesterase PaaI-like protein
MKPTDLAFNQALGIKDAPAGAEHLLELPLAPLVQNHLGTMHAAAQFALAEAASAERLRRDYAAQAGAALAVVRGVTVKYRKAATGELLAYAQPDASTREHLARDLATRSRAIATVLVELKDRAGTLTFAGSFDWFIGQPEPASP